MAGKFNIFLFTYQFEGKNWEFTLSARNAEEAKARLAAIKNAAYTGEVIASVFLGALGRWLHRFKEE